MAWAPLGEGFLDCVSLCVQLSVCKVDLGYVRVVPVCVCTTKCMLMRLCTFAVGFVPPRVGVC